MKKRMLTCVIVCLLTLSLVACGKDKKDDKSKKEAKKTTEATTEATTAAQSTTEAAPETAPEATTEDLSDTSSNLAKPTVPAYASDGSTVYLTLQEDETWTTDSGAVYYEGTDGVLRSRGNPDLTFKSPDEQ